MIMLLTQKNLWVFNIIYVGYSPPEKEDEQEEDLVQDAKRIEFHKAYLAALARAIRSANHILYSYQIC